MLLKLMAHTEANIAVDDPRHPCRIIDDVQEVMFDHLHATGEAVLKVRYRIPNDEKMTETFVLKNTAFLMNDAGKTIQTYSDEPSKVQAPVSAIVV